MATYMGFEPAKKAPYYFVSYSTEDSARVAEYCLRMRKDNLPLWYDHGIEHGEDFDRIISEHIRFCEAVLLFMSKTPLGKEDTFVRKEFNIARKRGKPIHVIYIDPITIDDVPVQYDLWWEELSRIQGVIAYKMGIEQTVEEIYKAIHFTPNKEYGNDDDGSDDDDDERKRRKRKPQKTNNRYSPLPPDGFRYFLGGMPYSDDKQILGRPWNGLRVRPLKTALNEIFYHWNTDQVFQNSDGSEFKPDFLKLLLVACRDSGLDGERIDEILAHNVDTDPVRNKNCKFFRLFYEEIFKGKDRPKEFYWSNTYSEQVRIAPLFQGVGDFSDKFCDPSTNGDTVRQLFSTHTKEICSFLDIDTPSKLFDNIMISAAERRGEVIWLDNSGHPPVNLGSVDDFIKRMRTFTDLKSTKSMVNFLRDFSFAPVSEGSERYVLKSREGVSFLSEIYDDSIKNEKELCELLGITEVSKAAIANYFTLLMEYVKITRPASLELSTRYGNIAFSCTDLAADVKRMVKGYCEMMHGENVPDAVKQAERSRISCNVTLAQAFEHHKVLGASKSGDSCDRYASLLRSDASAADYIRLFGDDNPTVWWQNKSTPLSKYVADKIDVLGVSDLAGFLENTPVVTAYVERNKKFVKDTDREFDVLFAARKAKFNEFETRVASIDRDSDKVMDYVRIEDSTGEPEAPVTDAPAKEPTESPSAEIRTPEVSPADSPEAPVAETAPTEAPAEPSPQAEEAPARAPEPPKTEEPPAPEPPLDPAPTRRARLPRKKSGDTSTTEQRLSELPDF